MFGAGWRKVEIYLEPEDNNSDTVDIEYWPGKSASVALDRWKNDLKELELPQSFSGDQKSQFFIYAHEHDGYTCLKVGWMAESLLQNLGLPYVVNYGLNQTYLYNPDRKIMECLPEKQ